MPIKRLEMTKFRVEHAVDEFGRLNLLTGPNGVGKSTRLLAIAWAVTGRIPTKDLSGAVLEYAKGSHCAVSASLDSGFAWQRSCSRDPQTQSVKTTVNIAGMRDLSVATGEKHIDKRVGSFVPMFDIGKFLAMRPEARREFIIDLCGGAVAPEVILAALKEADLGDAYLLPSPTHDGRDTSQIVERLVGDLNDQKESILNRTRTEKALVASIQEFTSRKNELEPGSDTATELGEKHGELRKQIAVLDESIGKIRGTRVARDRLKVALAEATKQREEMLAAIKAHEALGPELAKWIKERDAAKVVAETAIVEPTDEGLLEPRRFAKNAAERLQQVRKAELDSSAKLNRLEEEHSYAKHTLSDLGDWKTVSILAERLPTEESTAQVHDVRAGLLGLSKTKLAAGNYEERIEKLVRLAESKQTAGKVFDAAREATATAAKESDEADDAVGAREAQVAQFHSEYRDARTRVEDARRDVGMLNLRISGHEASGPELKKHLGDADSAIVEAEKERNSLEAESGESIETLQTRRDELSTAADATLAARSQRQKWDTLSGELARMIADAEDIRKKQVAAKGAVESLKKLRDVAIGAMMTPLIKTLQEVLGVATYCRLVNERGKPTFDLGLNRNGRMISVDALSGGERTMFCAALVIAMVKLADPPEKILLLEGCELDSKNLKILANVVANKASDFQCFLTSIEPPADLGAWTHHDLSGEPTDDTRAETKPSAVAL